MLNPVSVCSWVPRKFWREGASSRSRIRQSSVLGWEITGSGPPGGSPVAPCRARLGPASLPFQDSVLAGHRLAAVVPGSSDHFGSQPVGRWSACSQPPWPALPLRPRNACCSSHCRQAQGERLRAEPGWRGHQGQKDPQGSPDSPAHVHLQGRQGAGRHNPGCHAEHDSVSEDRGLGETLQGESREDRARAWGPAVR